MSLRRLIVNADDLGQSPKINEGIAVAAERGIVTSTSMMVRWPAAEEAAAWARKRSDISVGLHFDLGEWSYREGNWFPVYEVADARDATAVERELIHQLGMFTELLGRPPTHLDSHQHVHAEEPARSLVLAAGQRLGVPVRNTLGAIRYCGSFYGQSGRGEPYPDGVTGAALLAILDELGAGTTELGCHPGADGLDDLDSMYLAERAVEREVLCDPQLLAEIDRRGIELVSFSSAAGR